ncbi:UNVERIFIED_CONTAM: hypothetical protein GTU68_036594 [Idotea baltica]|nr:hypothetical protein [Idotea baltica]
MSTSASFLQSMKTELWMPRSTTPSKRSLFLKKGL